MCVVNKLRDKLIALQREETLRQYLGNNYENASESEKDHFLSFVDEQIHNDVDKMLNEFVEQRLNTSPEKKKNNIITYIYTVLTLILTGLSSYLVNDENWSVVIIIYIILILVQTIPYVVNKDY